MQATKLAFEKRYGDDSGVEFGVRLDGGEIEFEAVNKISFPVGELDWLIAALARIKAETTPTSTPQVEQGPHLQNCTKKLQTAGKAYPRTCAECGLGPCRA